MARPLKCRIICEEPIYDSFSPRDAKNNEEIMLTLDEYEAIRIIDFENSTHEDCAKQMNISRTTATEIYETARYKIACCLVNGNTLRILGGNYKVCDGNPKICKHQKCIKKRLSNKNYN